MLLTIHDDDMILYTNLQYKHLNQFLRQHPSTMTNAVGRTPIGTSATKKDRFVFEHVWKTGGTELCQLARA
jgi:hypothetical protein